MRTISKLLLMVLLSTGLAHAMEPMEGVPQRLMRDRPWGRLARRGNLNGPGLPLPPASCPNENFVSPVAASTLLGMGAVSNGIGVGLYISAANAFDCAHSTPVAPSPPAPPPTLSPAF